MKRFSEQFHTKAQSVKLKAVESAELRNRVLSYMEYHPLSSAQKTASTKLQDGTQISYFQMPFSTANLFRFSALVAVFMLVVIPVLAEKTIPGDPLYSVKVRFNEEVISTLKLSPYEKVEWETERLNRRIAEAKLLANEGKLTDEVEAEIVAAVQEHTESVEESIEELRVDDADQAVLASIELNSTLKMQSESLQSDVSATSLTMTDMVESSPKTKLADALNASITKQETGFDAATIPPYDKIMARVEINTTRAYELLKAKNIDGNEVMFADVTRRLEDVNRTINRANSLRTENETSASEALLDALQRSKKIIVFLSESGNASSIEALVPIEYTEEEYKQQLVILNEDINRKIEMIKTLQSQASASATEKALYAIEIAQSNQSATSSEPVTSVKLAKESVAVLDDALMIFEGEGVHLELEPVVTTEAESATSTEGVSPEENPQ